MEDVTVWERGCCLKDVDEGILGSCAEFHRDVDNMAVGDLNFIGRFDQTW